MDDPEHWQLEVTSEGARAGLTYGARLSLPETEALDAIASGRAVLSKRPAVPPYALFEYLVSRVGQVELLGPSISNEKQFEALRDQVLANGIRQTLIGATPLPWVRRRHGLREMVGQRLGQDKYQGFDPFGFYRHLFLGQIDPGFLRGDELKKHIYGYENSRTYVTNPKGFEMIVPAGRLPAAWRDLLERSLNLQADFEATLRRVLAEGRVITIEETRHSDRLIHPKIVSDIPVSNLGKSFLFLASSYLPASITDHGPPLDWRRKQAAALAEQAVAHFDALNLHLTATLVQRILGERFDLTPNAANEAWKMADIDKREFRNRPRSAMVTEEQLREFLSNLEGKKPPSR